MERKPRGFNEFIASLQVAILQGLKRRNNKKTNSPFRRSKIFINGHIEGYLQRMFSITRRFSNGLQLLNELQLTSEICSSNCQTNNPIRHFIRQGTFEIKINNSSSIKYSTLDNNNNLVNKIIKKNSSVTIQFVKESICVPTHNQRHAMEEFLRQRRQTGE